MRQTLANPRDSSAKSNNKPKQTVSRLPARRIIFWLGVLHGCYPAQTVKEQSKWFIQKLLFFFLFFLLVRTWKRRLNARIPNGKLSRSVLSKCWVFSNEHIQLDLEAPTRIGWRHDAFEFVVYGFLYISPVIAISLVVVVCFFLLYSFKFSNIIHRWLRVERVCEWASKVNNTPIRHGNAQFVCLILVTPFLFSLRLLARLLLILYSLSWPKLTIG